MRGVTIYHLIMIVSIIFLLTRLMRGVTPVLGITTFWYWISTHTPHARRDAIFWMYWHNSANFYSHASCEAWLRKSCWRISGKLFLLTRLIRGVTGTPNSSGKSPVFLLTRLMRGVTGLYSNSSGKFQFLLTRLMRGVTLRCVSPGIRNSFLLTRLMRGVTDRDILSDMINRISTHTPHARRDLIKRRSLPVKCRFLLTRLMRGVTLRSLRYLLAINISTHTPHARRDVSRWHLSNVYSISTHTPHARRDYINVDVDSLYSISTHTPHARRDIKALFYNSIKSHFYSHASCEAWLACSNVITFLSSFLLTRLMRGVTFSLLPRS